MAEFRSALTGRLIPGRYGTESTAPPVTLSEQKLGTFFQIAGWPGHFDDSVRPVLSALGFDGVGRVGQALVSGQQFAFRIAPERLLVRTDNRAAWDLATEASNSGALSLLDLSHARVVIRIEGMAAPDLLSRLVSLDLYKSVFTECRFALTGIEAVPVMLHRLADGADAPRYDLFVPYSWAASLWDLTCHSALSLGYEVPESDTRKISSQI